MTNKCIICNNIGNFKIKGENIYYCNKHAKEFFSSDSLENISKLKKGSQEANRLKSFLVSSQL